MASNNQPSLWDFLANPMAQDLHRTEMSPLLASYGGPAPIQAAVNQIPQASAAPQRAPAQRPPQAPQQELEPPAPSLQEQYLELMRQRQEGIQGMQGQIQGIEDNPTERSWQNTDLSPLMGWASGMAQNPGIAQGYQHNPDPTDAERKAMLQDGISKEQGRLGNDYVQMMAQEQKEADRLAAEEWKRLNYQQKERLGSGGIHDKLLLQGRRLTADGTIENIEGGSPWEKEQERIKAEHAANTLTTAQGQAVIRDTVTAIDTLNKYGSLAGGMGSLGSWLPESAASELKRDIDSIKGNIGVDQLLNIKKSGAGLGQVPQSQLDMLASLLGSLDTKASPDKLRQMLREVRDRYATVVMLAGGDPYEMARARGWDPNNPDKPLPAFSEIPDRPVMSPPGGGAQQMMNPAASAEPDWDNMSEAELKAYLGRQ